MLQKGNLSMVSKSEVFLCDPLEVQLEHHDSIGGTRNKSAFLSTIVWNVDSN